MTPDLWLDRAAHIIELLAGVLTIGAMLGIWRVIRALKSLPDMLHEHREVHGTLTARGISHPFRMRAARNAE